MPRLEELTFSNREIVHNSDGADSLETMLQSIQLDSVFYTHSELSAPWGLGLPEINECLMFHAILSGNCVLKVGSENLKLASGDFVLLPHGNGHEIQDRDGSTVTPLSELPLVAHSPVYETLVFGGNRGNLDTTLVCGSVSFSHPTLKRMLSFMPDSILIRGTKEHTESGLEQTVVTLLQLLSQEAINPSIGSRACVSRISDMLVIQAIRVWFESMDESVTGWMAALQDKKIGKAVFAIHEHPDTSWTVEDLASEASMSRTAFSQRFKELTGDSPLQYLMNWRLALATSMLRHTNESILAIALNVGYQSEAAFSRAYKKIYDTTPSSIRSTRNN